MAPCKAYRGSLVRGLEGSFPKGYVVIVQRGMALI